MNYSFIATLLLFLLTSCAQTPNPPVVDRSPAKSQVKVTRTVAPKAASPAPRKATVTAATKALTHTVSKGETLFSIGLRYGEYYKDIAARNNITPPYNIEIGQVLHIRGETSATTTAATDDTTGDVITPLNNGEPTGDKPVDATKATSTTQATKPAQANSDATASPAASVNWGWPANGKVITTFNDSASAKGIDIAGNKGDPILAANDGKVIYSGAQLRGYGRLIIIKHEKNYLSVYAHNDKVLVKEGQEVKKGQKIAEMGNTDASRMALHFEIRDQGKSVDPMKFLPALLPAQ